MCLPCTMQWYDEKFYIVQNKFFISAICHEIKDCPLLSGTMYVLPYVLNKYCIYMLKSLNLIYAFKEIFDVYIKKNETFISKVIKTDSF